MQIPFKNEEIKKAIMSLKNNKGTGIDNVKAELLKKALKFSVTRLHNDSMKQPQLVFFRRN